MGDESLSTHLAVWVKKVRLTVMNNPCQARQAHKRSFFTLLSVLSLFLPFFSINNLSHPVPNTKPIHLFLPERSCSVALIVT